MVFSIPHSLIFSYFIPTDYKENYNTHHVFYENLSIVQATMHYTITDPFTTTQQLPAFYVLGIAVYDTRKC